MKKFLLTGMSCLLLLTFSTTALANGWGLRGGIYDIVSDGHRYDGYSAVADNGNTSFAGRHVNHAVLQNRYHAVLIAAERENGCWQAKNISTTAVFQPGSVPEGFPHSPALEHKEGGFVLSYGEKEMYTFRRNENGVYYLHRADFRQENAPYSNCIVQQNEGMLFWQSGPDNMFVPVGDALWETAEITLAEFNIAQTPRSMAEVRRMSLTSVALMGYEANLSDAAVTRAGGPDGRMLPVYSAPDKASYRSGSGKASVSLGGDVQVYGVQDGWTLISYEVSPRTSRFGYIEGDYAEGRAIEFAPVALVAAADTFLTDDPFVSQFAQAYIPAGTELTGLMQCGEYYAYCEITLGGVLYRGFVPLKDLHTKYDHPVNSVVDIEQGTASLAADVRWDVMDALVGKWEFTDDEGPGRLIFFCGGGYRNHMPGDGTAYREDGNFRVYDGEDGHYVLFIDPEATNDRFRQRHLTLVLNEDGSITVDGVVYHRDEYSTFGNG